MMIPVNTLNAQYSQSKATNVKLRDDLNIDARTTS